MDQQADTDFLRQWLAGNPEDIPGFRAFIAEASPELGRDLAIGKALRYFLDEQGPGTQILLEKTSDGGLRMRTAKEPLWGIEEHEPSDVALCECTEEEGVFTLLSLMLITMGQGVSSGIVGPDADEETGEHSAYDEMMEMVLGANLPPELLNTLGVEEPIIPSELPEEAIKIGFALIKLLSMSRDEDGAEVHISKLVDSAGRYKTIAVQATIEADNPSCDAEGQTLLEGLEQAIEDGELRLNKKPGEELPYWLPDAATKINREKIVELPKPKKGKAVPEITQDFKVRLMAPDGSKHWVRLDEFFEQTLEDAEEEE